MPTPRRDRLTRLAWESLGVVIAVAAALVALAHTLSGAKRSLLLTDGDSVLLPLMLRAIERGEPFEWGMSPVLFVFPEFPLYAASAWLTSTVSAALLLNGVVNVVALYALLRVVVGRVLILRSTATPVPERRNAHPARPVVAALVGVVVVVGLILLETRAGGNTGEIVSLYLTTTYYSGTVMVLLATLALVLHLVGPTDGRGRRILLPALATGLLAAVSTLSNPLYALWVTGPLVASLAVLAVLRRGEGLRDPWWRPAATALALVAGSGAGYLARLPLASFMIADKTLYFRWGQQYASLAFDFETVRALQATPAGAVESVAAGLLLIGAVVAGVFVVVRRRTGPAALAALFAGSTVILVPAVLILVGSISTRYALPLLFAPLALLVVGVAVAPLRPAPALLGRGTIIASSATIALLVVVGLAGPATASVARAAASSGDPAASCLSDWARGKNVTGVAQFWTGRGLQAYGSRDVRLLQVTVGFSTYPWLVNLAPYKGARVGYVVVAHGKSPSGHTERWGDDVLNLGAPRDIVDCGTYDIYDFRGLPAAAEITREVDRSAAAQAAKRGFGW